MTKKSGEDSIHPSETAYDKAIKRMEEREAHIFNTPAMQIAADAAVAASTGDIPSVRHRVQHAWRYAWWTVLHSGKESTRKAVKIENNMIYWGQTRLTVSQVGP